MRLLAVAVLFALTSCASLDTGPDVVPLETDPPGATVVLRSSAEVRTMNGVTPMPLSLPRNLPDPIEIEFRLKGHRTVTRRLWMRQRRDSEVLPRAEWRWPTDTIRVKLVPTGPAL